MSDLTKNEEIMLVAVWRLKDNAYGVTLRDKIQELTGKDWNYGTLYCTLDQMVKKGILTKEEGRPMPERGGRRKLFYHLTVEGFKSLREAQELQQSLWKEMPQVFMDSKKQL